MSQVHGPVEDKSYLEPDLAVGDIAKRYDHRVGNYDFSQPESTIFTYE